LASLVQKLLYFPRRVAARDGLRWLAQR
jgi:hypothetical protein